MDQSQASILLSSSKFGEKAQEVIRSGLEGKPKMISVAKKLNEDKYTKVTLADPQSDDGGMMLYTSGTTSRPVGTSYILMPRLAKMKLRKAYYCHSLL